MPIETVCSQYIAAFNGAPVQCDCPHFSGAYLLIDSPPLTGERPQRICFDCAAPALRERLTLMRAQVRAISDLRAANKGA